MGAMVGCQDWETWKELEAEGYDVAENPEPEKSVFRNKNHR